MVWQWPLLGTVPRLLYPPNPPEPPRKPRHPSVLAAVSHLWAVSPCLPPTRTVAVILRNPGSKLSSPGDTGLIPALSDSRARVVQNHPIAPRVRKIWALSARLCLPVAHVSYSPTARFAVCWTPKPSPVPVEGSQLVVPDPCPALLTSLETGEECGSQKEGMEGPRDLCANKHRC